MYLKDPNSGSINPEMFDFFMAWRAEILIY